MNPFKGPYNGGPLLTGGADYDGLPPGARIQSGAYTKKDSSTSLKSQLLAELRGKPGHWDSLRGGPPTDLGT